MITNDYSSETACILQEIPSDQVNVRDDEELVPVAHFQKVCSAIRYYVIRFYNLGIN